MPQPVVFEVTGQLFAYSTNLLQHITVYKQYSQRPQGALVLAGLTRTPTEQNDTTMGDRIIAMCFQMVCYDSEQQEDYNTQYSIV